jgi:hypothetical protein
VPKLASAPHRPVGRTQRPMPHPPRILPGTGRGTIRRMVEGPGATGHARAPDGEAPTPPSPLRDATSPFRGGSCGAAIITS